ncbi:MAG: OmpA family protein [Bacteroidota bacterium]
MKKGLYYDLHFQVSLAETSTVFTTSLNALLTNKPLQLETSKNLSKRRLTPLADYRLNFVKLQCMGSYKDMENWVTVKARFKAKGGETNLVVGNFEPDATTEKGNLEQGKPGVKAFSYYYVDGMTLVESNFQGYQKNKPYIIKGLHFATDSYDLSKHAKHNIRLLYTRIKTMPNVTLTVNGHTDDVGSEGHNKVLSYNRAKAVAHFLVKLGFPEERMIWKGHGNTKPLASELTKAGRLQNRRVDFVITQPARR